MNKKVLNNLSGNARDVAKTKPASAADYRRDLSKQFAMMRGVLFLDVRDKKLSYKDLYLYGILLAKQGANENCKWGIESLQRLTGLSATSIKDSLKRLRRCSHITRQRRLGRSSVTVCLTTVGKERVGSPPGTGPGPEKSSGIADEVFDEEVSDWIESEDDSQGFSPFESDDSCVNAERQMSDCETEIEPVF